jgi:hypothetical protein
MSGSESTGEGDSGTVRMTVANIREPEGEDYVEVVFLESARFYRLNRSNPDFGTIRERLEGARGAGQTIPVVLEKPFGEVILDVDF